jgi:hypothetical protein
MRQKKQPASRTSGTVALPATATQSVADALPSVAPLLPQPVELVQAGDDSALSSDPY